MAMILEAKIPWSIFGVSPVYGARYGFTLSVSDNDLKGAPVQQSMVSSVSARDAFESNYLGYADSRAISGASPEVYETKKKGGLSWWTAPYSFSRRSVNWFGNGGFQDRLTNEGVYGAASSLHHHYRNVRVARHAFGKRANHEIPEDGFI